MNTFKRKKLAILTNIVAPYRIPIYEFLGQYFDVTVIISGQENNRSTWSTQAAVLASKDIEIKLAWGIKLEKKHMKHGRVVNLQYIHINPGYLWSLFQVMPDAIISSEMGFRTLTALFFGMLTHKPVWIWWGGTLHSEQDIALARKLLRLLIARAAKRWISYGKTSTEYLLHIGVSRKNIVQIQNCVDKDLFSSPTKQAFSIYPKPVLLYAGQLIDRKGLRLFLESAARIQSEGYIFSILLVGDGPERDSLRQYAETLQLRNIYFESPQPPEMMPAVYRSADILIFPTLGDVWGLTVNEALLAGVPVACSIYAGCAAEIVPIENQFNPLSPKDFDRILRNSVEGKITPATTSSLLTCKDVTDRIVADIRRVLCL